MSQNSALKKTLSSGEDHHIPTYTKLPPITKPTTPISKQAPRKVLSPSPVSMSFRGDGHSISASSPRGGSTNLTGSVCASTDGFKTKPPIAGHNTSHNAVQRKNGPMDGLKKGIGVAGVTGVGPVNGMTLIGQKVTNENEAGVKLTNGGLTSDLNAKQREWTPLSSKLPPCKVCGDEASGLHYGVNSCEACKAFFRRTLKRKNLEFQCTCTAEEKALGTDAPRKTTCPKCRYERCIKLGMSKDAIKIGRYTIGRKRQNDQEVKRLSSEEVTRRNSETGSSISSTYSPGQSISSPEEVVTDVIDMMSLREKPTDNTAKKMRRANSKDETGLLFQSLTKSIFQILRENQSKSDPTAATGNTENDSPMEQLLAKPFDPQLGNLSVEETLGGNHTQFQFTLSQASQAQTQVSELPGETSTPTLTTSYNTATAVNTAPHQHSGATTTQGQTPLRGNGSNSSFGSASNDIQSPAISDISDANSPSYVLQAMGGYTTQVSPANSNKSPGYIASPNGSTFSEKLSSEPSPIESLFMSPASIQLQEPPSVIEARDRISSKLKAFDEQKVPGADQLTFDLGLGDLTEYQVDNLAMTELHNKVNNGTMDEEVFIDTLPVCMLKAAENAQMNLDPCSGKGQGQSLNKEDCTTDGFCDTICPCIDEGQSISETNGTLVVQSLNKGQHLCGGQGFIEGQGLIEGQSANEGCDLVSGLTEGDLSKPEWSCGKRRFNCPHKGECFVEDCQFREQIVTCGFDLGDEGQSLIEGHDLSQIQDLNQGLNLNEGQNLNQGQSLIEGQSINVSHDLENESREGQGDQPDAEWACVRRVNACRHEVKCKTENCSMTYTNVIGRPCEHNDSMNLKPTDPQIAESSGDTNCDLDLLNENDLEDDITLDELDLQLHEFDRFQCPLVQAGNNMSQEEIDITVEKLTNLATSLENKREILSCDEIKKRHKAYLEQYEMKRKMFGVTSTLSQEEYLSFYNQTGIDIDNRQEMIIDALKFMEDSISKLVYFAKGIPGFTEFDIDDQVVLVKAARFEQDMIRYGSKKKCMVTSFNVVTTPWDKEYHITELQRLMPPDFCAEKGKVTQKVCSLDLSLEEAAIIRALSITCPDRFQLKERDKVEVIHKKLIVCLLYLLSKRTPERKLTVEKLLTIIFEVRELALWDNKIVLDLFEIWPLSKNHQLLKEFVST